MPPFPINNRLDPTQTRQATGYEKNLPTQCAETQTHARLPRTHEYGRWPRRVERTTRPRPRTAKRLISGTTAGQGLPKSFRILANVEYRRTLRSGRRRSDPLFTVYATANTLGHPRLGITVARKVSTKSVVRNLIKRQIRESFRQRRGRIPDLDIVVVARPAAAAEPRDALRESLKRHWEQMLPS